MLPPAATPARLYFDKSEFREVLTRYQRTGSESDMVILRDAFIRPLVAGTLQRIKGKGGFLIDEDGAIATAETVCLLALAKLDPAANGFGYLTVCCFRSFWRQIGKDSRRYRREHSLIEAAAAMFANPGVGGNQGAW